jgi:hypothetical protein
MKQLTDFYSRILPKVPGCPDPLVNEAVVDSCVEFCEQSLLIQSTTTPVTVTANQGTYTLSAPASQKIAVTMKVWHGTTELEPAPSAVVDQVLAYVSGVGTETATPGIPRYFYEFSSGVIGLWPVPNATNSNFLTARIATKPLRSATTVVDELYEDWADAICAGAVSRIRQTPGQPFSGDGTAERAKFLQGVTKATGIRLRGRISGSISVRNSALA